jgi:hypothetical protein
VFRAGAELRLWRRPQRRHARPLPYRKPDPRPVPDGFSKWLASLFETVAGIEQPIDLYTALSPLLDLVEIAIVGEERIVTNQSCQTKKRQPRFVLPLSRVRRREISQTLAQRALGKPRPIRAGAVLQVLHSASALATLKRRKLVTLTFSPRGRSNGRCEGLGSATVTGLGDRSIGAFL